jgi:hypothetical protein
VTTPTESDEIRGAPCWRVAPSEIETLSDAEAVRLAADANLKLTTEATAPFGEADEKVKVLVSAELLPVVTPQPKS